MKRGSLLAYRRPQEPFEGGAENHRPDEEGIGGRE
jgi:hypothetical protein